MKKTLKIIAPVLLGAIFAYGAYSYYCEFIRWDNMVNLYLNAVLILLSFGGICAFTGESRKSRIKKFFGGLAGAAAILFGLTFVINNIIFKGNKADFSISVIISILSLVIAAVVIVFFTKSKKDFNKGLCIILSIVVGISEIAGLCLVLGDDIMNLVYESIETASPNVQSVTVLPEYEGVEKADFYVSVEGNDENDGSLNKPFKTIERARDAVRSIDKTGKTEVVVGIMAGDYRTNGITFTAEDSGTEGGPIRYCKYGAGEVVINGGVALNPEDFTEVSDEGMLARLNDEAKKNVLQVDLSKYGITADDYGKLYAIGSYNTAAKYDGDYVGGIYSEIFFNDIRMDMARYPDKNADYLYTEEVVFTGEGREKNGNQTRDEDWDNKRNHLSDIYRINDELAGRINSWATLDDVWVFGWWKYDWADASSPVGEFNFEERTLSPAFVSSYGTKEGAPYYFYNVFEELTTAGEFYLDRENAVLYIYPTDDMKTASIDMSLTENSLITLDGTNYISFEGLTFKGTRGDAVTVNGNGNRISHSLIKNISGNAIVSNGYDNIYDYNEITRTGKGGITLNGGDTATLTSGNNRAENNLIHHWSEIYQTYQSGVQLGGVGNICANNEMYNTPHQAIGYGGNNHIIEYNILHDVCLLTNDGGAIYSGRRWDWYGNIIRYNYIYDLGSTVKNGNEEIIYTPDGIYWDDNLAGQTAYGNILVNVPKYGFHIGSGRDNTVKNNIIINSESAISYDNRAREGSLNDGWFTHHLETEKNGLLDNLKNSPWQTEIWQEAFPQYSSYSLDYSNVDNPNLPFNPSNSVISENIIVSRDVKSIGNIADDVYRFSPAIENNIISTKLQMGDIFTDPQNGDYSVNDIEGLKEKIPEFEEIPIDKMGIIH